jgi:TRAP transporter 4TM/12TM fusion protein
MTEGALRPEAESSPGLPPGAQPRQDPEEGGGGQRHGWLISLVAACFAAFHLYTGIFGVLVPSLQRTIHLTFAVVLAFLMYPSTRRARRSTAWADRVLALGALGLFGYYAVRHDAVSEWITFVTPFGSTELWVTVASTLLLLEASRRSAGLPLTLVGAAFLLYGRLGPWLPGALKHTGFGWPEILESLYFGLNGVFGIPIGVSATYIVVFVIFGAFFEQAGGGKAMMDFGRYAAGRFRGGPAKIAIVTSAFFGTFSGSAVANVYGTGTFTIPMMKRLGYRPEFAGAVEAAASTGGQIMPPVMGAAAFVMAEFLGMPYAHVMAAAVLPAVLYYLAVFLVVDLEAARIGLKGLPREELPQLIDVLRQAHLAVAVVVLAWALISGYSPMRAGVLGVLATVVLSWVRPRHGLTPQRLFEALVLSGRRTVMMGVATAVSGIVIGMVTLTGIGLNFVGLVVSLSGGISLVSLVLVMVATMILGMGVPTTVAYIIVAAVVIPALKSLGFTALASHMFAFYFAVISMITPPVAPASLAAAQLAGAEFFRTGFTACRLGLVAFVVPFMFIYSPELLLVGSPAKIALAAVTACVGSAALSLGMFGWYRERLSGGVRLLFALGGLLLIKPGWVTDLIGVTLLVTAALTARQRPRLLRGDSPSAADRRGDPSAKRG